jgi:hypothetical protein
VPDREWLGNLWLPWYVWRVDPTRPFEPIRERPGDAQQLQVRDVLDARAWKALSAPDPGRPDMSHAKSIERYEEAYRHADIAVFVAPAWRVPEGQVLIDGSHRACALYRLHPDRLDADVLEFDPPAGHPDVQPEPRATRLAG